MMSETMNETNSRNPDSAAVILCEKVIIAASTTPAESAANRVAVVPIARTATSRFSSMSYGVDYIDLYRRAAGYVDKILRGAKPADLPVQQATKFEFIINLKAAKQIELTIPVRVLEIANQVIR